MPWEYGWHMGWMMTWWSLVWALILLGMIWIVLRKSTAGDGDTPEAVLKSRYAHGEIGHDEYERRLHDLRK
jgi:uncharacterized membrane protein